MMDSLQAPSQAPEPLAAAGAAGGSSPKADALVSGGADGDFERVLERAERRRDEMRREWESRDAEAARERKDELEKAARRKGASAADAEAEARKAAEEGQESLRASEDAAVNPFAFKEERPRGRAFAWARIEAETTFPGGFRSKVSRELLLTGSLEKGAEGVTFGKGSPAGLLLGALKGLGSNLDLYSLDREGQEAFQNVLLASGMEAEDVAGLVNGLFGQGGADLNGVMRALAGGVDASLAAGGPLGGLTATPDGLNSLGQFLLGLGLSPEAVRSVTSGIEPGSVLPAATLRSLVSGGMTPEGLTASLGEGDLSYLALALQSMGAGPEAEEGIALMLEMKGGAVSVGDVLSFLETLERPAASDVSETAQKAFARETARDIQTVLANLRSEAELVKAPVFNEIILKLSSLCDRQLDRSFYELSPALQALRGGVGAAAGGEGSRPFDQGAGDSREERRGREERRLMASAGGAQGASGAGAGAAAVSGAFAAGLGYGSTGLASGETLVRELKEKLVYSARRGIRRLRMSLSPESLGGLDIELKVKGSEVTANIKAGSLEAYNALEREVRTLREELKAEGLELKLTVSYDGGGTGAGGSEGSFYGSDGRRYALGDGAAGGFGAAEVGGADDPGGAAGSEEISPGGGVASGHPQGTYAGTLLQAVV